MRGNTTGWWDNDQLLVINKTGATIAHGEPVCIVDYCYVMDSTAKTGVTRRFPCVDIAVTGRDEHTDFQYIGVFEKDCPSSGVLSLARNIYDEVGLQAVTLEGILQVYVDNSTQVPIICEPGDSIFFDDWSYTTGVILGCKYNGGAGATWQTILGEFYNEGRQVGIVIDTVTIAPSGRELVWCYIDQYARAPYTMVMPPENGL